MVKPARKQFNFPLNHSLVHSRTNEVIENFSYMMIFIFTFHKHTNSNATDQLQAHIKDRKGEEMVLLGRLHKNSLFIKTVCKETHNEHTLPNVGTLERNKDKCIISNKYATSLSYTAKKIHDFCLIVKKYLSSNFFP